MSKILVAGATSAIAQATARLLAQRGDDIFLAGRDGARLEIIAQDLRARGAGRLEYLALDLGDTGAHDQLVARATQALGGLDTLLLAYGTLGDQKACEADYRLAAKELATNLLGPISLLTILANQFQAQGRGCLAVLSSVAGDRGRQSNYVYGAAKGGLSVFLQGLRNRLHPHGVQVLTIKPGFVDTPMTKDFPKGLLWTQPQKVAQDILAAMDKGAGVLYTPWFWRWVMAIIKALPEPIFNRLKL